MMWLGCDVFGKWAEMVSGVNESVHFLLLDTEKRSRENMRKIFFLPLALYIFFSIQ
jgi:hypothetical protein